MKHGLLLIIIFFLLITRPVVAEDINTAYFYLENEPIYTTNSTETPGALLELLTAMLNNMGLQQDINFTSWRRAQINVQNKPDTWIYPLARTDEREDKYHWVMPLLKVPVVFVTKVGQPYIDTVEQAAQMKRVITISGSAQEQYLSNLGLQNVAAVPSVKLADILHSQADVAAFVGIPEIARAWRAAGYTEELQYGRKFDELVLWFAGNKEYRSISDDKWIAALDLVKASGEFDQIMQSYFGSTFKEE